MAEYHQQYLFDALGELDPDAVLSTVAPVLPRIRGVVHGTFDDLTRRRSEDAMFLRMSEGELAWWLWTQIHHAAKEDFHGDPALVYGRVKQQDFVLACESVALVFKKLRRRTDRNGQSELVTANYRTRQNMDFWGQRAIEGIPELPRIVLGYELREELSSMRCYLGLPAGSNARLRWHRELPDPEFGEDWAPDVFEREPLHDWGFEIEENQPEVSEEA